MTDAQKILITDLLAGCSIYGHQFGFLLRGTENNFIRKINPRTYRQLKHFLRKEKSGLFVIDKRKVRSEHGNTFIKKAYKNAKQPVQEV